MAIVATILFWFLCRAVGSTKDLLEQFVIVPDKIDRILPQEEGYVVTRRNGEVAIWNPASKAFDEIFAPPDDGRSQGPEMMMGMGSSLASLVYLPDQGQLLALDRKWSQSNLLVGTKSEGWRRESTTPVPNNTRALFLHAGQPLVVADGGVYQVDTRAEDSESEGGINIFGVVRIPQPNSQEPHANISEGLGDLPGDARIAYDGSNGQIYVHGARQLVSIAEQEGIFRKAGSANVDWREVVAVSAGGGVVVVAHRKEEATVLAVVDGSTLATRREVETSNDNDIRRMAVSVDGRWLGCLFDNDELFLFDLDPIAQ